MVRSPVNAKADAFAAEFEIGLDASQLHDSIARRWDRARSSATSYCSPGDASFQTLKTSEGTPPGRMAAVEERAAEPIVGKTRSTGKERNIVEEGRTRVFDPSTYKRVLRAEANGIQKGDGYRLNSRGR